MIDRSGGLMVRVLAFYTDGLSLNAAEVYSCTVQLLQENNENKQKETWTGPFFGGLNLHD